ncbi:ProQ/FINO family protein [Photobacterium damselae]|uniref:ProQ/FINO family protein n=1 Tax=Photobacterium damselae TaxID=38293 RepID=UPI0040689C34
MNTEQKTTEPKKAPTNQADKKPAYTKSRHPRSQQNGKPPFKKGFKKPFKKTASKPKKKLTPSKARGSRCYLRCKEIWGDLFDLKKIKPFSMHIRNELIEDAEKRGIEISSSVIYTGLHWVVNTYLYQKALTQGGFRFDMHGNETTEITEDQIKLAKENAEKIKEKRQASRKKTPARNGQRKFNKDRSKNPRTPRNGVQNKNNQPQKSGTFKKHKPETTAK